jgi:hypothetical protein
VRQNPAETPEKKVEHVPMLMFKRPKVVSILSSYLAALFFVFGIPLIHPVLHAHFHYQDREAPANGDHDPHRIRHASSIECPICLEKANFQACGQENPVLEGGRSPLQEPLNRLSSEPRVQFSPSNRYSRAPPSLSIV